MNTTTSIFPLNKSATSKTLTDLIRSLLTDDVSSSASRSRKHKNVFLLDGGTGEELVMNGVPYDSKIWSARAITEDKYHSTVQRVHESFIASGCDAITTNSYGIVPGVGLTQSEIAHYCSVAGQIARRATHTAEAVDVLLRAETHPVFVLGSLGPLVESYHADNIMSRKDGIECYTTPIHSLQPYVDAFIAETLSSVEEAIQVLQAFSNQLLNPQRECLLPTNSTAITDLLFISFTVNADGYLRSKENIGAAISSLLDYHASNCFNVQILGILLNCSEPESITKALQHISCDRSILHRLRSNGIVLGAYANRLIPIQPIKVVPDCFLPSSTPTSDADTTTECTDSTPHPLRSDLLPEQYYCDFVQDWVLHYNVRIIGGCCGITPHHIAFLHDKFNCE